MIAARPGQVRGKAQERERIERGMDLLEETLVEQGGKLGGRLAALTAPMSKQQGDRAAARDVATLFGGKARVARLLKAEGAPRKAAAWLAAIEKGAGRRRLRSILKGTALAQAEVLERPDPAMHKRFLRRSRRRRKALKIPKAVVRRRAAVEQFLERQQAQVGRARKGWADAARGLGGTARTFGPRGEALGSSRVYREGRRVTVELTNGVRYARFLMSRGRRRKLVEEARVKALGAMREKLGL